MTGPNGSLQGEADSRQILISQDIWNRTQRRKYGGWGYAHILDNTLPVMRAKGMSEDEIRILMVENPAHLFAFAKLGKQDGPGKEEVRFIEGTIQGGGQKFTFSPLRGRSGFALDSGMGSA